MSDMNQQEPARYGKTRPVEKSDVLVASKSMSEAMHEGVALGLPLTAVTQQVTTKDDGKGGVGDCHRACVASLLGMDVSEVPHFARYGLNDEEPDKHGWWWAFVGFCDTLNPSHEVLVVDEPPPPSDDLADLFGMYLATGKSPRGDWNHVVVCRGGEVIWDPHPDRLGIVGDPVEINVVRRRRVDANGSTYGVAEGAE